MNPKVLIIVMLALFTLASTAVEINNSFKDERDQQVYKTVKIGKQLWFAENLNYETPKSLCYKRKKKNCEKYGRLYPFDELDIACPKNWRVPTIEDCEILKSNFKDQPFLALADTIGWNKAEQHSNDSGLSLRGTGYQLHKRLFMGEGNATSLWINQFNEYDEFYHVHFYGGKGTFFERNNHHKNEIFHAHPLEDPTNRKLSIRCVCEN